MFNLFLALHVLAVVFVIGPLAHAATTAGRGIRTGDGAATALASRTARIYANVSVVVVILGFGLMSMKDPDTKPPVKAGEFSQTWIWLSLLLWLAAMAIVQAVLVPTLDKATQLIAKQESVVSLTARVGAAGGVVGVLFAVIIVLMVYRPGS